jgi:hypothetical protein
MILSLGSANKLIHKLTFDYEAKRTIALGPGV